MKYDDAGWHSGGDFPATSPEEYGGTHIALFLRWCFSKGWAGEIHINEESEDTRRVTDGTMPATEYLYKYCDGKLTNEDLNEEGNRFAERYYSDDGLYLADYTEEFAELMYINSEESHDYAKFSKMLESRFRSGVLTTNDLPLNKPWWKVW